MDSNTPLQSEAPPGVDESAKAATAKAGTTKFDGSAGSNNGIRIIIPSNTEFVRVVRLAVLGVASRMNFTFEDIEDIKLAVSEACNNAILHARAAPHEEGDKPSTVEIVITPYTDRIEIEVADGGYVPPPGLKPRIPNAIPGTDQQELRESGLGLFLMQTLMDHVEHRTSSESSTIVHMVKHLPRPYRTSDGGPATAGNFDSADKSRPSSRA